MAEPKRKYKSETILVPAIQLEPIKPKIHEQKEIEGTTKTKRQDEFHPEMILEIIERIKKL